MLSVYGGYKDEYNIVLLSTIGMILCIIVIYGEKIVSAIKDK